MLFCDFSVLLDCANPEKTCKSGAAQKCKTSGCVRLNRNPICFFFFDLSCFGTAFTALLRFHNVCHYNITGEYRIVLINCTKVYRCMTMT